MAEFGTLGAAQVPDRPREAVKVKYIPPRWSPTGEWVTPENPLPEPKPEVAEAPKPRRSSKKKIEEEAE